MKLVPDITYDHTIGLSFDLYLPQDLRAKASIVYAHGGGAEGRRGVEVGHFAQRLTDAGFALIAPSYRLNVDLEEFPESEAEIIETFQQRSRKVGLKLPGSMIGAQFVATMEDLSRLIEHLWVEGGALGLTSRKVGVLGVSGGGVAALGLAYPPLQWANRLSRPDAVVALSSAVAQPWRLEETGPPCLLLNGENDPVIDLRNVELAAARAEQVGAPLYLVKTGTSGNTSQVDAALDGSDSKGRSYMDMLIGQFEILLPEKVYLREEA